MRNQTKFPITVDSTKTIAQMIADGKYDGVNSDITKKNFPTKGSDTQSVSLELVHLNRTISTQDMLSELANRRSTACHPSRASSIRCCFPR